MSFLTKLWIGLEDAQDLRVVALKNNGIADYYADKNSFSNEALLWLGAFSQVYIDKLEQKADRKYF